MISVSDLRRRITQEPEKMLDRVQKYGMALLNIRSLVIERRRGEFAGMSRQQLELIIDSVAAEIERGFEGE